jgi:diguanylate cyclase (GGDEF)-like protein
VHLHSKNQRPEPTSLRKRYFSLTILLGILVIGGALFFFASTLVTKQKVSLDRVELQKKQLLVDKIRNSRFDTFRNVELFLLDPTIGHYDRIVRQLINSTHATNDELFLLIAPQDMDLKTSSASLKQVLIKLQNRINDLFKSRLNINQQYPGLALSNQEMMPVQKNVNSQFQILIEEIVSGDFQPASDDLIMLLLSANLLWEKQVSQYRSYLANRFASFTTDFLRVQAETLQDQQKQFASSIENLAAMYAVEDSFEGPAGVQYIKQMVKRWHLVFRDVREIHESKSWRTDNLILEQNIIPLVEELSVNINTLDSILKERGKLIDSQIEENTNALFVLITAIIVLFLFFISTILFSLDRMVFHPISLVSRALKLKAFNHQQALQIKTGKSREISNLVEAFLEMDKEVNQRQNELEQQALHDNLTALPNRFMLNQRLDYQILTSERKKSSFTLFFIDLNNFKDVNDTLGHSVGDKLLIQVANRLSKGIRKSDTVARLGGDEFAILLPDTNKQKSERIATILQSSINNPFMIQDKTISMGMSIGIVHYPKDGADAKTLLQHADSAMYLAKRNRKTFAHYDKAVDTYSQNRLTLVQDLRHAIENDELMIYYQPQMNCNDNVIYGAEALIRWNHPEFGFIQPDKIIDLAEYSGIIHQLTFWILKQAIAECSLWHKNKHSITLSVNLSVQDLNNQLLYQQVNQLLEQYHLDASYLTLEITESGMMENPAHSIETLNKLKTMGLNLSVDDFGTGFSSLKYLKQLPVDELKIDKSFVMDMANNENDRVIVQSTINLGHNLGLEIVAEGIEDESALAIISRLGCDRAQGYYFEKPLSADNFFAYLRDYNRLKERSA